MTLTIHHQRKVAMKSKHKQPEPVECWGAANTDGISTGYIGVSPLRSVIEFRIRAEGLHTFRPIRVRIVPVRAEKRSKRK